MTIWEYHSIVGQIRVWPKGVKGVIKDPFTASSEIWTRKDESGKTIWDTIKEYGKEGWELVSVTPIAEFHGCTIELLYTFKKPQNS